MELKVCPPVELENLLPFDLGYKIFDRTTTKEFGGWLRKGLSVPIHTVELNHLIGLRVEIPDAGVYRMYMGRSCCELLTKSYRLWLERNGGCKQSGRRLPG
jgi:hypothetical protein